MIARRRSARIGLAVAAWMAAAALAEAKTMLIYIRGGEVVHTVLLDVDIDCKTFQPASSANVDVVYCESGLKIRKGGTDWGGRIDPSRVAAPAERAGFEATWRSAPVPASQSDTVPLRENAASALAAFPPRQELEMLGDADLGQQVEAARRSLQDLAAGRRLPPAGVAGLVITLERADLLKRLGLGRELGEAPVRSSP